MSESASISEANEDVRRRGRVVFFEAPQGWGNILSEIDGRFWFKSIHNRTWRTLNCVKFDMKGRQPRQHELESGKLPVAYNVMWIAPENTELPQ